MYMRVASPRYAVASRFCRSLSYVTPSHSNSRRIHHVRARGESSLRCGESLLSEPVICHSTAQQQ